MNVPVAVLKNFLLICNIKTKNVILKLFKWNCIQANTHILRIGCWELQIQFPDKKWASEQGAGFVV